MRLDAADILDAIRKLFGKGFDRRYGAGPAGLVDLARGSALKPSETCVEAALRFESAHDVGDASNIYAIRNLATGEKGILIDEFDVFDELCARALAKQLAEKRETTSVDDGGIPSKHGLRKVLKSDFDRDPTRYVLREGFPDFPPCPFGGAFSILGFDLASGEYVLLVTSIIRDPRLARIPYRRAAHE